MKNMIVFLLVVGFLIVGTFSVIEEVCAQSVDQTGFPNEGSLSRLEPSQTGSSTPSGGGHQGGGGGAPG
ncbi:MAG: hypothetical protein WBA22_08560 [Candidatus Methanofastidiosia archaeon]